MKNFRHPSFIIGVISILILFIGIGAKSYGSRTGDILIIASVVLGAIHWIWSVVDVAKRDDLKPQQRKFWLIIVIIVPVMGGLLFYIMHQRRNRIVT
ncbi:MAG: PLDc N-terminal domain-containing protein [Bacteroidota bacterium]|nr:PLDc N-terminal domain-containing protein [Flavisolibacter sp.]MDQ3843650.1 PLDc N-terminal domain-containing protein [Bacteroidota bacterium]MBD0283977.1 PLDc N-terminal domain-containing protein [Flavisolibacter sp.]MBD0295936.1 PLDc N-terminal domain-containing protein [Flavisolibacter sp.]MBD0349690.1 PLDc N-terminal domain-containing protein [Flavisolibacter sp.]